MVAELRGESRLAQPGGAPRAPPLGGAGLAAVALPRAGKGAEHAMSRESTEEPRGEPVRGRLWLPAVCAGGRRSGAEGRERCGARCAVRGAELAAVRCAEGAGAVRGALVGALCGTHGRAMRRIRRAGCGERDAERCSPRLLARGLVRSPGLGVDTVGDFPAGCPGTISAGGCVSGGRAVLAEHRTAPPAPVLNTAVRTGEGV